MPLKLTNHFLCIESNELSIKVSSREMLMVIFLEILLYRFDSIECYNGFNVLPFSSDILTH